MMSRGGAGAVQSALAAPGGPSDMGALGAEGGAEGEVGAAWGDDDDDILDGEDKPEVTLNIKHLQSQENVNKWKAL